MNLELAIKPICAGYREVQINMHKELAIYVCVFIYT